ncbi:MAG: GntR family transcriptional regulator [Parasporobacterium sp.]|nr:GntR family transcriptional regulator [Parasporobacterium sp.]MBQ9032977.1 GntR family transcriptional regulator [Parasporobacterium sp.]
MHTIDNNSSVPLYNQVREQILFDIRFGNLKKGEKLPSELDLAKEFGVSRITIRKAMESLEAEEILIRKQGKGTFITSPKTKFKADDQIGFTKTWEMLGKTPKTQVIKVELVTPEKSIRDFLEAKEDEPVVCSRRLRFVDDVPISLETNYYSKKLNFLISEDLNGSLFHILIDQRGLSIHYRSRILTLCRAKADEAQLLGVKKNSPLIQFKDSLIDDLGKPLYYSIQIYNADDLDLYLS